MHIPDDTGLLVPFLANTGLIYPLICWSTPSCWRYHTMYFPFAIQTCFHPGPGRFGSLVIWSPSAASCRSSLADRTRINLGNNKAGAVARSSISLDLLLSNSNIKTSLRGDTTVEIRWFEKCSRKYQSGDILRWQRPI